MPFTSRLAPVALLLLAACAGWESASPNYAAPPEAGPTPSHHTPPAPDPVPDAVPPDDLPTSRVAISSVQLLQDCPDAPEPAANEQARAADASARKSSQSRGALADRICEQSTVQLAIDGDRSGPFRIDAIRVLDAATGRTAGTTTLRAPTRWLTDSGTYGAWDGRIAAGAALQVSYKLGELDVSRASETVGPDFNTFMGPFMLELDVSIDGARQTIRSNEFGRQPIGMIQT